ncbi:hypothetical protein MKX01_005756 [Papaver californicum]|nr:hypothetical protein MKX01_005756 [Papaver californicum]
MIIEDNDAMLMKLAESFSSIRPYFTTQMVPMHVIRGFIFHTPREFSRKYLPSANAKIILRNPSGKYFTVNFINSKRYRY